MDEQPHDSLIRPVPIDNEPTSGLLHFAALLLSVVGVVALIGIAAFSADIRRVVVFSVFGASVVLLYLTSAVYHLVPASWRAKRILQRVDHAMIFVLIAGTYTPICLVALRGGSGWGLFGVVWALALGGIVVKAIGLRLNPFLSVFIYILMGWLVLVVMTKLISVLPQNGIAWLFAGGFFYTIGTVFFGLDRILPRTRWIGMHEIFHLFVIAGSFSHFWVMYKYIVYL